MSEVWSTYAADWRIRSPQRPAPSDCECMLALAAPSLARNGGDATVAVLGVTPEVVVIDWPGVGRIHALDSNRSVLDNVWKPNPKIPTSARQCEWRDLPLESGSVDLFVGDGSLNCLPEAADYGAVLAEIARTIRADGVFIHRCYLRPDAAEDLDQVASDTWTGKIGSVHVLRWRIAMALPSDTMTVAVAEVRDAFDRLFPDRARLADATGWPHEEICMIDAYAGVSTRYSFPTRAEFDRLCAPGFIADAHMIGDYELAERCPTIRLRPVESASSPQ